MLLLLSAMSLGLVETTVEYDSHQRLRDAVLLASGVGDSASESAAAAASDNDTNPFRSVAPGDWTIVEPDCASSWRRPNQHLYFQLGNACFFLAFLATHGPCGQLWLRSLLCCGCVLLVMWGWLVECSSDAVLWSGIFLAVNAVYVVVLLCRLRPVRFDKELESVYGALFRPLRVSRLQFRKVLGCMRVVRALKYQEVYAQEKVTKVDSLSLVLSGKLVVSQNQRALHIVFAHQFLDSPEWFGVSTDDYFQVSIMAMEDSRILIWHRDKLKLSIMSEPFLETVFDHILGRDVVKKLMQVTQVSESIAASNGCLAGNGGVGVYCYDESGAGGANGTGPMGNGIGGPEDKQPMLMVRKNGANSLDNGGGGGGGGGGHGITALINRQLQEEQAPLLGGGGGQSKTMLMRTASVENLTNVCDATAMDGGYGEHDSDDDVDDDGDRDGAHGGVERRRRRCVMGLQKRNPMQTSMC